MDRIGKSIEKKLEFNHHEKVGVVNALVGASTMLIDAPRLLNLEHNHYINNSGCKDLYDTTKHKRSPKSNRKATCCQLSSDDSTLAKVCRIWTKNGLVEIYSESSLLGVGSKLGNDRMGVVAIFSYANLHTTILTLKVGFGGHRHSNTLKSGIISHCAKSIFG
ncbi:hypothetical protein VitviT2T_028219 [Vitis vinifera]|uniref:Uncharacterized protein n=1 Tax=Vitis vinifera TaxID=29760 RepID=A0ABY9DU43_VITVI|nr:hypothetical protein VitviT2T_028219 [Vitis vinifera]